MTVGLPFVRPLLSKVLVTEPHIVGEMFSDIIERKFAFMKPCKRRRFVGRVM